MRELVIGLGATVMLLEQRAYTSRNSLGFAIAVVKCRESRRRASAPSAYTVNLKIVFRYKCLLPNLLISANMLRSSWMPDDGQTE